MDKVTLKYERKGNKQFHRDVEYSFEYEPEDGIEELISGFRVFLRALGYSESTINQYVPDPDEVPAEYEIANKEVFDELKEKISNDRRDG